VSVFRISTLSILLGLISLAVSAYRVWSAAPK
jgi:hypothetical protein